MEDLCQRIPCVAVMIFENLNNQSLIKSKVASKELSQFMLNERFYWLRIVMKNNKNFMEYHALWKKLLEKTPVDIIQQVADAVQTFFTERTSRQDKQWTPLHIIAQVGLLELYKYTHGKLGEINPQNTN